MYIIINTSKLSYSIHKLEKRIMKFYKTELTLRI